MSDKPGSSSHTEKAFAIDLPQLEKELALRSRSATVAPKDGRAMIAGLIAGMTHVGKPAR